MSCIAIITARGGSKRIPGKNIKEFLGKPIIAYSIEAAITSGLFSKVIVSTDSDDIAKIAKKFGAEVPFMRSEKNSDDYATTVDVLVEVIEELKNQNEQFNSFCCLYPTAPFVTAEHLKESFALLNESGVNSVVPMVKFSFPPQRAFKLCDEYIEYNQPEYSQKRSQDLEPLFHDVGQFYWSDRDAFLGDKALVGPKTKAYLMSELDVQDIDTIEDWKLAELKFKLRYNQ